MNVRIAPIAEEYIIEDAVCVDTQFENLLCMAVLFEGAV